MDKNVRRYSCIVLTLVLAAFLTIPLTAFGNTPAQAQTAQQVKPNGNHEKYNGFRVVGYYSGDLFDNPVDNLQLPVYTHINYGFLIPQEDGSFIPIEKPDKLRELVEKGHAAGVKIFVAVGGYTYQGVPVVSNFEKIGNSPELLEKFTQGLADFAAEYNIDGIDLDWESPKHEHADSYEKTVLLLKSKLAAQGMELSASVNGTRDPQNGWEAIAAITDKAAAALDFINLMCYDLQSDVHHSPLFFGDLSIDYWLNRGLAADKIVLGMPLYARPSWLQYQQLIALDPENAYRDYAATQPLDSYYNGLPTLREKTLLAMRKAGGVMIFDINEDTQDGTSAISMIGETVRKITEQAGPKQRLAAVCKDAILIIIDRQPLWLSATDGLGTPFIDGAGRTLVPVRKPLEALGVQVDYDTAAKTVTAVKGGTVVKITIGKSDMTVNGQQVPMDTKAVVTGGRTYIPLRAVFSGFGYTVNWSDYGRVAYVVEATAVPEMAAVSENSSAPTVKLPD
ncbi:glycosyl hydrolase family 18 protein [Desulforamulus aeronauticus]|uniref:chitinase n=1 Tax=Desulforamulus aeronauticus DSM 10349 TaxID=1121421 RepID=A0A1M6RKW3_9FIRM|nr:glycosyl hydrolase family 18 protein [Desulforamulus aeronauticus]SHK33093.1 Copper amine oxidase N-terminal domain-containing protein [Desulforamulus aeronauticus DSM 10349]